MQFKIFIITSLGHELSPIHALKWPGRNRLDITCNTSSTHHVQHVMNHVVQRDNSAVKFSQSLDCIYLSFILLAETINLDGGEETRVPRENP